MRWNISMTGKHSLLGFSKLFRWKISVYICWRYVQSQMSLLFWLNWQCIHNKQCATQLLTPSAAQQSYLRPSCKPLKRLRGNCNRFSAVQLLPKCNVQAYLLLYLNLSPPGHVWSIAMSNMSVCLSVRQRISKTKLHEIFCSCYTWPWLGPWLTTMQYLMYFRFCGWGCHVFTTGQMQCFFCRRRRKRKFSLTKINKFSSQGRRRLLKFDYFRRRDETFNQEF